MCQCKLKEHFWVKRLTLSRSYTTEQSRKPPKLLDCPLKTAALEDISQTLSSQGIFMFFFSILQLVKDNSFKNSKREGERGREFLLLPEYVLSVVYFLWIMQGPLCQPPTREPREVLSSRKTILCFLHELINQMINLRLRGSSSSRWHFYVSPEFAPARFLQRPPENVSWRECKRTGARCHGPVTGNER